MARNTVDACLFCGHIHSGNCGGTPQKPKLSKVERVRPAKKPAAEVVPATKAATTSNAVRAAEEEGGEVGFMVRRPNLATVQRVRDPEEEELARAITLFAERDMLGADSLREHRKYIRLPDHQVEAMIWREVNREQVAKHGGERPKLPDVEASVRRLDRPRESPGLP